MNEAKAKLHSIGNVSLVAAVGLCITRGIKLWHCAKNFAIISCYRYFDMEPMFEWDAEG